MGNKNLEEHERYEIRVKGCLDKQWANGFEVSYTDDGDTLLKGTIHDQAELYGVIKRFRDLGISLVSVRPLGECESN